MRIKYVWRFFFGQLEIGEDRKLASIDSVMDDAAAFGLDLKKVNELISANMG